MFSPLHKLGPPPRFRSGLLCADSHNSTRTAIRSRLCGPNTFSPLPMLHIFRKNFSFYRARALFLSAQAWHLRISLETRSAHACAVQTSFRPFWNVFCAFIAKMFGLLRFGAALLRLSHAWPFSVRNAIRSRLCSPNMPPPIQFRSVF